MNRAARSMRSGSSLKDSSGASGVRSRAAARSATPSKGSISCRSGSDRAMALTVKSRRDRSASMASANTTSGLRLSEVVGLGPVGRDLHARGRRRRRPMVPNRLPWVHTASAQPATSRSISSGPGVGREVEVAASVEPAEDGVADDPADQVQAVPGGREKRDARSLVSATSGRSRSGITAIQSTGGAVAGPAVITGRLRRAGSARPAAGPPGSRAGWWRRPGRPAG